MGVYSEFIRVNKLGKHEQLCWSCDYAIGKCQWSSKFKPINGWDAEYVPATSTRPSSYRIYDCPLFERYINSERRFKKDEQRK